VTFLLQVLNFLVVSGCVLDYKQYLDDFAGRHRPLQDLELLEDEWKAIALVADWLKVFRSATTQMSTTKKPMLSTTHAIFRGLQEHIQDILHQLPDDAAPQLKAGLLGSHKKLSDYYFRFDESPYYIWAACKCIK
jgi:hypothetical protein